MWSDDECSKMTHTVRGHPINHTPLRLLFHYELVILKLMGALNNLSGCLDLTERPRVFLIDVLHEPVQRHQQLHDFQML